MKNVLIFVLAGMCLSAMCLASLWVVGCASNPIDFGQVRTAIAAGGNLLQIMDEYNIPLPWADDGASGPDQPDPIDRILDLVLARLAAGDTPYDIAQSLVNPTGNKANTKAATEVAAVIARLSSG